jgi:hypothetical protein
MSQKNSNLITIITSICVAIMIAAGIFLYEEPEFKSPNTIEENIVFLECKNSQMDVWVRTSEPIYGIQFEFEGVTLDKSQGGYLDLEGFNTSHNEKMMLAFSFEGKSIPVGEFMLLSLDVTYDNGPKGATISNMVLAGEGGSALDFGYFDFTQNITTLRSTY